MPYLAFAFLILVALLGGWWLMLHRGASKTIALVREGAGGEAIAEKIADELKSDRTEAERQDAVSDEQASTLAADTVARVRKSPPTPQEKAGGIVGGRRPRSRFAGELDLE